MSDKDMAPSLYVLRVGNLWGLRIMWSWREELNLQPAVYKTAALPLSYASYSGIELRSGEHRARIVNAHPSNSLNILSRNIGDGNLFNQQGIVMLALMGLDLYSMRHLCISMLGLRT